MKKSLHKGVTLIETVIYLALYAILMSGAILSAYALISTSARNQTKALAQEEGNYLIAKIDWALTGAKAINEPNDADPATDDYGTRLSITKYDTSVGDPLVFVVSGSSISFGRSGDASPPQISNSNVTITCPIEGCFRHTSASGDGINPESLTATFTITARTPDGQSYSQDFSTAKYLRK